MHVIDGAYSERMYQLCKKLFTLSTDGFLLVDQELRIAYINEAYCQRLGVGQEKAIGKPVSEIIQNTVIPDLMQSGVLTPEHNVLWMGAPGQYASGESYSAVSRQVVTDENGTVIGAVGQVKFVQDAVSLARNIETLNSELASLKNEMATLKCTRYTFEKIIGISAPMLLAKELAKKMSVRDFSALITGESGTGKELFANAIHYAGTRGNKPIVRVNCAAIPPELFESELFGYAPGAFTGSRRGGKKGKIVMANGGTLFLDEIGDMPLPMQAKLLRVLQEREVDEVGGEDAIPVDIRVIAATNKNLEEEIAHGRFRLDLYYRIHVIELHIPPLRERLEDLPSLVAYFLKRINKKYGSQVTCHPDVIPFLMQYRWPGNIRELNNMVERAYILADGSQITSAHFPLNQHNEISIPTQLSGLSLETMKGDFEKQVITTVLCQCNGNVKQCADMLQVHRSTLYNKLQRYNLL